MDNTAVGAASRAPKPHRFRAFYLSNQESALGLGRHRLKHKMKKIYGGLYIDKSEILQDHILYKLNAQ